MKSPRQPKGGGAGGRPAGFALPKHRPAAPAVEAGVPARPGVPRAVRPAVSVSVEDLRALRPAKELSLTSLVLAVLLRKLRVRAGLSQRGLAARAGLSRTEIRQLEKAVHAATVDSWVLLCRALRTRFSRLTRFADRVAARGWQL